MSCRSWLTPLIIFCLTACATPVSPTDLPHPATPAPTATLALTPTPAFDSAKLGTAELEVPYCSPKDKSQKMDVYYPSEGGPWPVLMYVHGGGWDRGDKAEGEGWRFMNERGFLVVSVNYRLAEPGQKFPAMIEDVKCAVRYLRAHAADYNLDSEHIGAVGASAGGHLVALLGTADESAGWDTGEYADQSSRVQAVVSQAGFSDFTREVFNSIEMAIYYAVGELPGQDTPKLVAASPVTCITPDDPPFLIIHGDKDGTAPIEQSQVLYDELQKAGVESTFVIVKNGPHNLNADDMSPTSEALGALMVAFFEEHLRTK
jgi:acetyl esterase/lipase